MGAHYFVHDLLPTKCCTDRIHPRSPSKGGLISLGSDIPALINTRLSPGCFPTAFRHPVVHPLIKKPNLDHLKIAFLSEVLEKMLFNQLQSFLTIHKVCILSGFGVHHITETALIRVLNDVILTPNSPDNVAAPVDVPRAQF